LCNLLIINFKNDLVAFSKFPPAYRLAGFSPDVGSLLLTCIRITLSCLPVGRQAVSILLRADLLPAYVVVDIYEMTLET
jgi:hypothetical protein